MNLKHALLHSIIWRKQFYLSYFLLIAVCAFYYQFSPYRHPVSDAGCLIISFFGCCMGIKQDTYSWKYFQSLPFSKRELFHFFILIQIPAFFPMLVWVFVSIEFVLDFIGIAYKGMNASLFIVTILLYLAASMFIGMVSFYHSYEQIRAPYSKIAGLIPFLQKLRDSMYYAVPFSLVTFLLCALSLLSSFVIPGISDFSRTVIGISVFFSLALSIYYWWIFRRWNREELSYTKINFKPLRDIPIMSLMIAFITFSMSFRQDSPSFYGNSSYLERVFQGEKELYNKILSGKESKAHLNQRSSTGVTPLMAAASQGNLEWFKAIEGKGASKTGEVNFPKVRYMHKMNLLMLSVFGKNPAIVNSLLTPDNANSNNGDFSALHLAAHICSPEIVDLLIEKGAKIDATDKRGATSLHYASSSKCLPVIVSLIEAGANPNLKNKLGKLAKDLISPQNDKQRIGYYFEKKMRSPAGK